MGSNGMALDEMGRLTVCEPGNRRVTRTEPDGSITIIADQYDGKKLNSPNDLVYRKSDGALYFTDPPHGLPGEDEVLGFCVTCIGRIEDFMSTVSAGLDLRHQHQVSAHQGRRGSQAASLSRTLGTSGRLSACTQPGRQLADQATTQPTASLAEPPRASLCQAHPSPHSPGGRAPGSRAAT